MTDETPGARLQKTQNAYRRLFVLSDGEPLGDVATVLKDLGRFCKITEAAVVTSPVTGTVDPIATGVLLGRQEVYARIEAMLHMSRRQRYTQET